MKSSSRWIVPRPWNFAWRSNSFRAPSAGGLIWNDGARIQAYSNSWSSTTSISACRAKDEAVGRPSLCAGRNHSQVIALHDCDITATAGISGAPLLSIATRISVMNSAKAITAASPTVSMGDDTPVHHPHDPKPPAARGAARAPDVSRQFRYPRRRVRHGTDLAWTNRIPVTGFEIGSSRRCIGTVLAPHLQADMRMPMTTNTKNSRITIPMLPSQDVRRYHEVALQKPGKRSVILSTESSRPCGRRICKPLRKHQPLRKRRAINSLTFDRHQERTPSSLLESMKMPPTGFSTSVGCP